MMACYWTARLLSSKRAWTTYTGEARRFIAAARAMGLVE